MDTISRLTSRLLADDSVFSTVQRALLKSFDARKAMERNIERLLAGANLPSLREIERVIAELAELDREVAHISKRVAALSARIEQENTGRDGQTP
jgi:hypothetical protein